MLHLALLERTLALDQLGYLQTLSILDKVIQSSLKPLFLTLSHIINHLWSVLRLVTSLLASAYLKISMFVLQQQMGGSDE